MVEPHSDLIDYHLPEGLIAQTPLPDRSASRLLMLDRFTGEVRHLQFRDCLTLFEPNDVLVVNETRVTATRVYGQRDSSGRGKVELLLLAEIAPNIFRCLVSPAKKLVVGQGIFLENQLYGRVLEVLDAGLRVIEISSEGEVTESELNIRKRLNEVALSPLPPYIKQRLADRDRYQTVYAESELARNGSAAAPTAGLHFTQDILDQLVHKGVQIVKINLQIGLDTFRPMTATKAEEHIMHGESCAISAEASEVINQRKGKLIAVGTTTVRTLETFARESKKSGQLTPGNIESKLFLKPGDNFKIVDGMFTNFHMPKTTMLLMIAAFSRPKYIRKAYEEAVAEKYRFLSFGDSMFIGKLPKLT